MIRTLAKPNETEVHSALIKNGKFFVNPSDDGRDFKQLFADLINAGAGRPVDADGFVEGAWTPELLADAISSIDAGEEGIELRSVQLWFQDNEKGIGRDNRNKLAKIFGCDDPDATSDWQRILNTSHARFVSQRRAKKAGEVVAPDDSPQNLPAVIDERRAGLAVRLDALFEPRRAANLVVAFWFAYAALIFMNYALGTLSVTYQPVEGLDKQVGFIWAPSLTVLPILVLPAFILSLSRLLTIWKNNSSKIHAAALGEIQKEDIERNWAEQLQSHSLMFKSALVLCVGFVFGFQWAGIYLPIYSSGDPGPVQIDRYLVTLFRPEVISIPEAVVLSMVGYMYTSSYIFLFLIGLIFIYIVASDFAALASKVEANGSPDDQTLVRKARGDLIQTSAVVVITGIWLATCIKLQITYLSSDGMNFWSWFANDAMSVFGLSERNGWLGQSAVSFTTTSLMALLSFVVLIYTIAKTAPSSPASGTSSKTPRTGQIGVVVSTIVVATDAIFAGTFVGFSFLTILSFIVLLTCLWQQYSTGVKLTYD